MKLVRVDGLLPQLDELIAACCLNGDFHPEPAVQHMSGSLGYVTLSEDNPYTPDVQQMEELFRLAGQTELPAVTGKPRHIRDEEFELVHQVARQLQDLSAERDALVDEKNKLAQQRDQFAHFSGLDVPLEDILGCEYIKIRFGFLPKASYARMTVAYAENPHVLFVTCGEEAAGYWGLYFTPRETADEIDGIFSTLFFERLHLPAATGTPAQIVSQLDAQMAELDKKLADVARRTADYWAEEEKPLADIYRQLKWHQSVFDMRHYAACRDNYFFFVGWVPADKAPEFEKKAKAIPHMRVTVSDPGEVEESTPPTLLKNLTLLDNILLPLMRDHRQDRKKLLAKARRLMQQLGIADLAQREITQVSGGQLQRAGICRALMNEPQIIFGDEPTGALNSRSAKEVLEHFTQINANGTAVLLVTHDTQVAARASRVLFMQDGRIVSELALAAYTAAEQEIRVAQITTHLLHLGI